MKLKQLQPLLGHSPIKLLEETTNLNYQELLYQGFKNKIPSEYMECEVKHIYPSADGISQVIEIEME